MIATNQFTLNATTPTAIATAVGLTQVVITGAGGGTILLGGPGLNQSNGFMVTPSNAPDRTHSIVLLTTGDVLNALAPTGTTPTITVLVSN